MPSSRRTAATGCLTSKEGSIIMNSEGTLKRCEEYIREHYYDEREDGNIQCNNDRPHVLITEVVDAICH